MSEPELRREVVFANGAWTTDPDGVNWTVDPVFEFATEVEALTALEFLSDDYRAAVEQSRHIMRYIKAAIAAAQTLPEDERPRPQGIINHTRLARQTVYDAINGAVVYDATNSAQD